MFHRKLLVYGTYITYINAWYVAILIIIKLKFILFYFSTKVFKFSP